MPTIKDFGTFKVHMFFRDHAPPHFHVVGPDFRARVRIADAMILDGSMPAPVSRRVRRWAAANRALLESKWKEYQ